MNNECKGQRLDWHDWPNDKPTKIMWYLVEEVDSMDNYGRPFDDCLGMAYWTGQGWQTTGLNCKRWAEVLEPGKEQEA